jgi:hypothetical protein
VVADGAQGQEGWLSHRSLKWERGVMAEPVHNGKGRAPR